MKTEVTDAPRTDRHGSPPEAAKGWISGKALSLNFSVLFLAAPCLFAYFIGLKHLPTPTPRPE
jgi:hypothetical protein